VSKKSLLLLQGFHLLGANACQSTDTLHIQHSARRKFSSALYEPTTRRVVELRGLQVWQATKWRQILAHDEVVGNNSNQHIKPRSGDRILAQILFPSYCLRHPAKRNDRGVQRFSNTTLLLRRNPSDSTPDNAIQQAL